MVKIKMKNSVTVAETVHDFLMAKKAAGVSEKTLLTYGQHFSAVSKHLSLVSTPVLKCKKTPRRKGNGEWLCSMSTATPRSNFYA